MESWTRAVEQLGIVQAIKASFIVYPLVNAAHIAAIGALLTSVVLMDLRLLGWFAELPERPFVQLLRRVALAAFALAALTGVSMFAVRASDYAASRLYWIKMGLILLAGLNFLVFTALDRARAAGAPLTLAPRLAAILSILLWLSVLVAGRFLGFV